MRAATLLKETLAQVFSFEFCKVSSNTFSEKNLGTIASLYKDRVVNSVFMHKNMGNPFQANVSFLYPSGGIEREH